VTGSGIAEISSGFALSRLVVLRSEYGLAGVAGSFPLSLGVLAQTYHAQHSVFDIFI